MSRELRNVRFADIASLCPSLTTSALAVGTRRSIEAKRVQARTSRHRGLTRRLAPSLPAGPQGGERERARRTAVASGAQVLATM